MKRTLTFILAFVMLIGMLPGYVFATEQQGTRSTASPYLQQLPDSFTGCSNLYNLLAPVKGYYTSSKYDTSNGNVLSVVIPEILPSVGFPHNNPHHIYDVWEHTLFSVAVSEPELDVRVSLLFRPYLICHACSSFFVFLNRISPTMADDMAKISFATPP